MIGDILHGNHLRVLKKFPDNYFSAVISDPPYGYQFMGQAWDYQVPSVKAWKAIRRVVKPGAHLLIAGGTRTQHRMAVFLEDAGFEIRDVLCWHYAQGFPKSRDISKAIDTEAGRERIILGQGTPVKRMIPGSDQEATGSWIKDNGRVYVPTLSAAADSQAWEGWGTALKPATELWTLARRPLESATVAANVLVHGTGALAIDRARISFQNAADQLSATFGTGTDIRGAHFAGGQHALDRTRKNIEANDKGRWPANVLLDEAMAAEMDRQSGWLRSGEPAGSSRAGGSFYGRFSQSLPLTGYGDQSGASRFFYVAKPSAAEKNAGLPAGCTNQHPTVKPITLMRYLLRLVTPPGGCILDPYAGSGTTGCAAELEDIPYVLIEKEVAHCRVARARCGHWHERRREEKGQLTLFP